MNILHLDTATEWRGGQQQLAYLLAARPGDRWAGVPGSPLAARVGPPALALLPGNDPRNVWRLRQALPRLGVDLLAAHTPHAHGLALFAGPPVVVHRRVDFAIRHPWKYRRARGVVAVSGGVARVLERAGVPRAQVRVVHDGVPARASAPPMDLGDLPRPIYGAVGALVPHKGHLHAIDAMAELPGSLVIAGEGELRPALQARIATSGLSGRVRLLGHLPDVAGLLAAIDVLVHPSLEEGMGQVLVEAMAAGCRIVTTRAGGIPEVVGEAAELVEPGDRAALANAMARVLARPHGEGVERAARFSVERMVAGTAAAYAAFAERGDG